MKKHFRHMALSVMIAAGMCVPGNGVVFAAPDTTGRWGNENQGWRYYNAAGAVCTGWIETASGWYYLDPQTGLMLTGLQQIDGQTYYFTAPGENEIEGRLFCGWREEADGSRRFFGTSHDGSFGSMKTGWQWIDGYCYYFAPGAGTMVKGGATPDGFQVNEQGQWVSGDGNAHFESGKGFSSTEQKAGPGGSMTGGGSSSGGGSHSGGSSSNGSGNNSGNNGNNNGNNSGNTGDNGSAETPEVKPLLKEATTLVNLGWTQYAVFAFNEGSIDDYSIEVDGIDITAACTNVDDNGTIVKWQTTVWNPGTVNVTRNADGEKQRVTFSKENVQRVTEAGDASSAPANLVTNGPVSAFDYYLDNYDSDGNVRVHPGKTTFAVNGTKSDAASEVPSSYYVPDAEIDQDGKGEILVKLSLKTEEQEAWFSKLTTIKAMDTDNKIVNGNLTFTTSTDDTYGKTGVIRISLPATNLRSRGQYQLNLVSSYSKNKLTVPVELVDATDFNMSLGSLNPNPKKGECFTFDIVGKNGESFGNEILSPIYRVDLTMPSGKVKTLTKISQWYEIGSMLHICGVDTDDEENVITDEEGVYTVTVYAHGYKTMSKKVEIGNASAVKKAVTFLAQAISVQKTDDYGVDAVSSATSIGGGSSSGSDDSGSGSSTVNGWLVFDHDLLANALILNEINPTAESSAVAKWYFDQNRMYVTDDNADEFYNFTDYLNAVKDAKLEDGRFVSFEQYQNKGTPSSNGRPYQIKRVLEDGKLGSTETLSAMVGKNAPVLTGTTGKLGENLVLTAEDDTEYFKKIQGVYLDGSAIGLRNDDYMTQFAFSEDGTQIIIYAYETVNGTVSSTPLSAGEHTLRIVAEGYKETTITLTVSKEAEVFELSLAANPERADGEEKTVYHAGQTVYVNASAEDGDLKGDFLKNLKEVTLNNKIVFPAGEGQIGSEEDYQIEDGMVILGKNLFKKAASYTLQLKANADAGYAPKTLEFEVKEAVETPAEDGKAVPTFREAVLKEESGILAKDPYYQIFFDGVDLDKDGKTEDDVEEWLRSKTLAVYVDGEHYESGLNQDNTNCYSIQESDGFYKSILAIRPADMSGEHSVKITADGYKVREFYFTGSANEQKDKDAPVYEQAEVKKSYSGYGDYYNLTFSGSNARDFFSSDSLTVTVNGNPYTKLNDSNASVGSTEGSNIYAYASYSSTPALELRPENMSENLKITITAKGYKSCNFTVEVLSDEKVTPVCESATYVKAGTWDPAYYRIDFTAEDEKALSEYLSDKKMKVTVNGYDYDRAYSLYSSSTKKFVAAGADNGYGMVYSYLKLSADAFEDGTVNEVEISVDGYETITFNVGESDEIGIDDIEAIADVELPAEDEIIASDDKKEEISDDIIDEDNTSDDIKDTDSADDSEDKVDESEDAADDKSYETGDDESEDQADDVTDEDDAEDTDAADKDADADEEESSETEEEAADAEEDSEAEME